MKKIMFSDKYLLTQAVLNGTKTMTRRLLTLTLDKDVDGKLIRVYPSKVFFDNGKWLFDYEGRTYNLPKENYPRYEVGEVVAIAQSYKDLYSRDDVRVKFNPFFNMTEVLGWKNKLFVETQYMLHHIRITDVKIERLQDISDDNCLREGLKFRYKNMGFGNMLACEDYYYEYLDRYGEMDCYGTKSPKETFSMLIDKICGYGTWERNPWVVAYEFEKVD